jgi:hypothetical protein
LHPVEDIGEVRERQRNEGGLHRKWLGLNCSNVLCVRADAELSVDVVTKIIRNCCVVEERIQQLKRVTGIVEAQMTELILGEIALEQADNPFQCANCLCMSASSSFDFAPLNE